MWVGVDAEWRAVINNKGRESRDKKVEDKDKDKEREVRDAKHANIQQGAATLQVCTILYYFNPTSFFLLPLLPLLHLSLLILLLY